VAQLIESRGFVVIRRSARPDLTGQDARAAEQERRRQAVANSKVGISTSLPRRVFLGDTMGELRKFYSLASVVFVGRTLVPMGGLGKPMIVGPYTENFADAVGRLAAAGGAAQIRSADELAGTIERLVLDVAEAQRLGAAAREVVRQNVGATRKTVDILCEQLG